MSSHALKSAPTAVAVAGNEVASSRTHYRLEDDLESLHRVHAVGASEGVAFYAGRILEVLSAQALQDLGLPPHQTVLANLDILEQYSLMPLHTRYGAHALRRLANDARHVLRPIHPADAKVALFFVNDWMDWYFRQFLFGPKRTSPLFSGRVGHAEASLGALLASAHALAPEQAWAFFDDHGLAESPVPPAMLAEAFLHCGRLDAVKIALAHGLKNFADDARLTLLHGLFLSRHDELEPARHLLETLFRRFANDAEVAGVLAGAYKRLWQKDPTNSASLRRAFDTYHAGWKASRETCTYLGTNAAATALWLGRADVSHTLASTTRTVFAATMQTLAARIPDPLASMEYWAGATLAELQLLCADVDAARLTYRKLFNLHAEKQGSISVTKRQAALILTALGRSDVLFDP